MNIDLECIKKYLEIIYFILAIIAFFGVLYTYVISNKQLYGSTMFRFIDIYRNNFVPMEYNTKKGIAADYVDFVNEELFFFKKGFIPKDAFDEWLDGMITYLPIYKNDKIQNPNNCLIYLKENDIYYLYPRVRKVFDVKKDYNFAFVYSNEYKDREKRRKERKKLVEELLNNIKNL